MLVSAIKMHPLLANVSEDVMNKMISMFEPYMFEPDEEIFLYVGERGR